MPTHIAVLCPVYNDWEAFGALLGQLARTYAGKGYQFHVVAVDDGSADEPPPLSALPLPPRGCIVEVELLRLAANLGHQRAIAVGLCHLAGRADLDAVVVMDCDGEDRPEDIERLCEEARRHPGQPVLARRAERSEGPGFRACYMAYKGLFRMLTGKAISFGNYSLLPMKAVRRLVHMSELWNNLAAAIMRSRLPYRTVPTVRGTRYAGRSKMNLVGLVLHGLSAMSVYSDTIFVRILLAGGAVSVACVLGMVAATAIRFGTTLAIPGWTTTVVGDLMILLVQTLVIVVSATLMMLAGRSQRGMVPIRDAEAYLAERERWVPTLAAAPAPASMAVAL